MECCCHEKTKHRTAQEQKNLTNRLSRIEGQVRGLRDMLQKDAYCTDILVQVSAVNAALNSFSKELLASHIRTCVADGISRGDDEVIDELGKQSENLIHALKTHLICVHACLISCPFFEKSVFGAARFDGFYHFYACDGCSRELAGITHLNACDVYTLF